VPRSKAAAAAARDAAGAPPAAAGLGGGEVAIGVDGPGSGGGDGDGSDVGADEPFGGTPGLGSAQPELDVSSTAAQQRQDIRATFINLQLCAATFPISAV
jgi:hypothetical protein